jgi:hypothetical protein
MSKLASSEKEFLRIIFMPLFCALIRTGYSLVAILG